MTTVLKFPTPTGTSIENDRSPPAQRIVLRVTDQAEIWMDSAPSTASQDAYRLGDLPDFLRPRFRIALITTFAPEPYELKKPLPVSIYQYEDEYSASFFDANIHTTGDNEQQAFENIKSLILDMFDGVVRKNIQELGPGPRHQLSVLKEFISKS